ncbi:MAG: alanine racemase [Leptospiraceae bacterium]|nr:alanine racemase [Leptospiraceae bacterium]MDW7975761.1 alanine racemase [Leptospiraceae bacterium]
MAILFFGYVLSWIEIDSKALKFNIENFKSIVSKKTKLYAVVKSNAYGHGIKEVVSVVKNDVDGFALNHISEIQPIYEMTDRPFLIMGGFEKDDLKLLLDKDPKRIFLVVSNKDQIQMIKELAPEVWVYLKVDTGMSRLGYRPDSKKFTQTLEYLKEKNLNFVGLMTHFSNVEDVTEQNYAYFQLELFEKAKKILYQIFPKKKFLFHTAASAATMLIPESHQDLVRIGISLYGLWPSLPTKLSAYNIYQDRFNLKSVLTWKTKIVHINEVPENSKVGYGCTYQTSTKTKIAVLPVGYNEGYDRSLSNRSSVIINNKRAMVIGRVCMNMIMVDITHIKNAKVGDEVILIGKSENEEITADELAEITGTINYEIVTRIHPSIPRIVI